jgi:hypothetical protein
MDHAGTPLLSVHRLRARAGREGGPLWLSLTGREGVKPFLKIEFGVK